MCTPAVKLVLGLLLASAIVARSGPALAREPALRFSAKLPVSAAMAERVRFWVDVFTRVSHTRAILHDRNDPSLVYDIVPYGAGGDATPVEAARASYERLLGMLATERLGRALGPASLARTLGPPSLERVRVEAMFGQRAGPTAYFRALGNVRAQRGMKEVFTGGLVRAELYLPAIRRIFREADVPPELVYLPHVESSFNPTAVSRAGAVGLWQFTRDTFEHYVKSDDRSDGRWDPLRSTEVAARHLTRAFSVLGSWPLAVASYNHGVAGMVRARTAVGADSLDDIVRGYDGQSFGFASENFYAEVLAAAHVANHARHYFPDLPQSPVMQYVVRPGDSLWTIARRHRVTVRDLTAANNLGGSRLKTGQLIVIKTS
jgi:membrane-bound lytic murein transglycosylase D